MERPADKWTSKLGISDYTMGELVASSLFISLMWDMSENYKKRKYCVNFIKLEKICIEYEEKHRAHHNKYKMYIIDKTYTFSIMILQGTGYYNGGKDYGYDKSYGC